VTCDSVTRPVRISSLATLPGPLRSDLPFWVGTSTTFLCGRMATCRGVAGAPPFASILGHVGLLGDEGDWERS
jgi:hypothetical protein